MFCVKNERSIILRDRDNRINNMQIPDINGKSPIVPRQSIRREESVSPDILGSDLPMLPVLVSSPS